MIFERLTTRLIFSNQLLVKVNLDIFKMDKILWADIFFISISQATIFYLFELKKKVKGKI